MAEAINGNTAKVFLLLPVGNDYLIQPVTMGSIFAQRGNSITFASPLASFQFDSRNAVIGENLTYNNPNAKVFFEGKEEAVCGGNFFTSAVDAPQCLPSY
ncbi:MAG: hypothetical protein HC821_04550 [Lewinella sp.]|nr:hypothetical protein [Lewinella sp.]